MSDDNLLSAYDFIRDEFEQYKNRIANTIESKRDSLSLPEIQSKITEDFENLAEEWKEVIASARNRFGVSDLQRILIHLGLDENGKNTKRFSGT